MKKLLITLSIVAFLSCSKKASDVPPAQVQRAATGEWVASTGGGGGFNNFESFKNYQFTFDVATDNQAVDIGLTSAAINVQYALFNPLGQLIDNSDASRSLTQTYTLNAGKYRLVICSDRLAVGKFSLTVKGVNADPARIVSQILQSGTQNWGPLGGGGYYKTFKNHFYTFDITEENTSLDIELQSPDTNVALVLYNDLGQLVDSQRGDRYEYLLGAVKKGTYTAMVCTDARGSVGNYSMNIFGKIANLQKVVSQTNTATGSWANNSSYDTYTLQLTAKNSPVDIELSSATAYVEAYLQTGVGDNITFPYSFDSGKSIFIVSNPQPAGTYRILVKPQNGYGSGNYTLNIFGQYTNFKKL